MNFSERLAALRRQVEEMRKKSEDEIADFEAGRAAERARGRFSVVDGGAA